MQVKVYETTDKGVVEHQKWSVDASELCAVEPKRWSMTDPRVKSDAKADKKSDAKA